MGRKKKESELTPEQRVEESLKRELKELYDNLFLIPEPTYHFNIGNQVKIGALEDVLIEEILEKGKIYKIDYTSVDNNYGNPIRNEHCKRYVKWVDIRKITDNKKSLLIEDDLKLRFMQNNLASLFSRVYHFGTDFNPEYQREFVWELEDKVSLIDSIFNNIDIGKFVFIHNGYYEKYLYQILDGKQRIRAILDFYEDRFAYKGYYFSDLCGRDQSHFENYPISVAEVENATQEQIYKYFLKLNTSGKVMSKEQLDKVRKMLEEML